MISWWGHMEHVGLHNSICIPTEASRHEAGLPGCWIGTRTGYVDGMEAAVLRGPDDGLLADDAWDPDARMRLLPWDRPRRKKRRWRNARQFLWVHWSCPSGVEHPRRLLQPGEPPRLRRFLHWPIHQSACATEPGRAAQGDDDHSRDTEAGDCQAAHPAGANTSRDHCVLGQ